MKSFEKEMNMCTPLPRKKIIPLPGEGPEDVVVDREGNFVVGLNDGRVLRVNPLNGSAQELVNTGGRPLGLEVLANGHILICESPKGLLDLDPGN
jgi:sugar lactone lactonase YvrE